MITPGALADALAALPVSIADVRVQVGAVWLADYSPTLAVSRATSPPGGPRPTSVVRVSGAGHSGFGENVAFSAEEHHQFAARASALPSLSGPSRVGEVVDELMAMGGHHPYQRAALEAAVIDLGMRQAGVSLSDLSGVSAAPLRFVVSFAACADPAARVRLLRAAGCTEDLKIDVDPGWPQATCEELARQAGIAILDFKGRGDAAWARLLAQLFPGTIFEDPPPGFEVPPPRRDGEVVVRISRDAPLTDAPSMAVAVSGGESINLKAPRMGGPLQLLRGLDHATRAANGPPAGQVIAYFGGMFEIGVGRLQARRLAALYCGGAPNDLASNTEAAPGQLPASDPIAHPAATWPAIVSPARSPLTVRLDGPGLTGRTGKSVDG